LWSRQGSSGSSSAAARPTRTYVISSARARPATAAAVSSIDPTTDYADGKDFLDRGREDRHQFRFIVAPEDGDRIEDLRSFTRDVMQQMQEDLGTRLDWVAIDHFNTGHPPAMC
jgi:type IV secretory pathway VirD2 relaxase